MPRAKKGAARHQGKVRVLKAAKGYVGGRSRMYRVAAMTVARAEIYATRDRRRRKRDFRRLWITRITAALMTRGMSYAQLIYGMKKANIILDRKIMSDMAIADPAGFDSVVAAVRPHLTVKAAV
jgi:large subunit ribosomal protein L20